MEHTFCSKTFYMRHMVSSNTTIFKYGTHTCHYRLSVYRDSNRHFIITLWKKNMKTPKVQSEAVNPRRLGVWCLTPLSTIFQLYRGGQFYWWRKLQWQILTAFNKFKIVSYVAHDIRKG